MKILRRFPDSWGSSFLLHQGLIYEDDSLFVAYILEEYDERMAEDAAKLLSFVKNSELRILDELM